MHAPFYNIIQRVKIQGVVINGRSLVQYTGLDNDVRDQVELLHPFGWVAAPIAGADAVEVQNGAVASHKVVIAGDHTADTLSDLQPGESGMSRGGQQLIQRLTGTEVVTGLLRWGFERTGLRRLVQEEFMALFNAHTHKYIPGSGDVADSEPPTQQMTEAQLTGNE